MYNFRYLFTKELCARMKMYWYTIFMQVQKNVGDHLFNSFLFISIAPLTIEIVSRRFRAQSMSPLEQALGKEKRPFNRKKP